MEELYSADGRYFGKFGKSSEVRVTHSDNIKAFRNGKMTLSELTTVYSVSIVDMPDYVKSAIYTSIYKEIFGKTGNVKISSGFVAYGIAQCDCNGYGSNTRGNKPPEIIVDNTQRRGLFADKYNIKSVLFKENQHLWDGGISVYQRDLEGHLPLIRSKYFKKATAPFQKEILQSVASFLWGYKQASMLSKDPGEAKMYKRYFDNMVKKFKKAGVEFDFKKQIKTFKHYEEFMGFAIETEPDTNSFEVKYNGKKL